MRRLRRIAASVLAAGVLGACRNEAVHVAERLDTSISWLATVEAVTERWNDNRLPGRFAEGIIMEAGHALQGAGEEAAARAASSAGETVRDGDRPRAPAVLAQLRHERDAIAARRSRLPGPT